MYLHTEIDETTIPYNWFLLAKVKVSEDNYRFIFASEELAVINELDKLGANWLLDAGKEFKVIVDHDQLVRVVGHRQQIPFHNKENDKIFAIARCLAPSNLRKIGEKEFANFYDIFKNHPLAKKLREETDSYVFLDLYVHIPDKYEDLLSAFLAISPSGTPVTIVGPYGVGLRISEKFLNKNPHLLVICEGNALARYLDVAYYMVMKEAEDSVAFPYNIRLTMFIKMQSEVNCVGLQVLQKALNIKSGNLKVCFHFVKQNTELER